MSARKPHQDFAGYTCELRNRYSGGHTIILDCKAAPGYSSERGRWQVLCNEHSNYLQVTNLAAARDYMKEPTDFCLICRAIAGQGPEDWETSLAPHEVAQVWTRRGAYLASIKPKHKRSVTT